MNCDDEEVTCKSCEACFSISDFDGIDNEYSEKDQLCPDCSEEKQLKGKTCDICGEKATNFLGSDTYCDEHFEDLLDD